MISEIQSIVMKQKKILTLATAIVALASCSSDDMALNNSATSQYPEAADNAIVFGSTKGSTTRSDITGVDAANLLGKKFVVSGYKGPDSKTTSDLVFDNYLVTYLENTAKTTASNSTNWEYVGVTPIKHATDHGITSQKVKYWDYSKEQYDFIAWSTGTKTAIFTGTPADGEVLVSAITATAATAPATGLADVYTFQGKAADLSQCYIADLVTVKKAQYGDNPVQFRFRQLGTKVRIAIYETIPGYSVKDVQFYSAAASNDASAAAAKLFTTTTGDIYSEGTYTVYFPTIDNTANADNNQAHVTFNGGTATQATLINWGAMNYTIAEEGEKSTGKVFLGRTSATASYAGDAATNYYITFLPNESGTNLNLRVNYTLESIDGSGEKIYVKGATAQVPSIYTCWKPGFAYTYIFKISDKTNGHTGTYDPTKPDDTTVNSDPAGLYPITFDAVVENAEDNDATQETITSVNTPSITTYQKGSTVVNDNEYKAITGPIFVTVNEGSTTATPDLANGQLVDLTGKAALYTLSNTSATEADVIDALQVQDDDAAATTIKGRSGLVLTPAAYTLENKIEYGVNGNAIDLTDGTKKKALKFTAAAAGTYAFVYTKTAATTTTAKYQPVTKTAGASVSGYYRYALTAATAGDVQKGVKYFNNNDASAGMLTVFVGQGVGNLYVDNAGTKTIASGYAQTGTTYYYTLDGGQSYIAATNIAYADFATATLYTDAALTTPKTETTPVNGKAYYDGSGKYCVIMPQQTTGLYVIDTTESNIVACGSTDVAVNGMVYFDKYSKNDGVYYTKVIKVQ